MTDIYIKVAVAAPIIPTLTYALPENSSIDYNREYLIGKRVLVPLGKRKVTGYIIDTTPIKNHKKNEQEKAYSIKRISSFLDDIPIFHAELVPFFQWIANYYLYPLGMVIKTALPAGLTVKSQKKIIWCGSTKENSITLQKYSFSWLHKLIKNGELSAYQTNILCKDNESSRQIEKLYKEGLLQYQNLIENESVGKREEICWSFTKKGSEIAKNCIINFPKNITEQKILRPYIKKIQEQIKNEYGITLGYAQTRAIYTLYTINTSNDLCVEIALSTLRKSYATISTVLPFLTEKELVAQSKQRIFRDPFADIFGDTTDADPIVNTNIQRPKTLSQQQQNVLNEITPAITAEKYQTFLLFGITGSGKTEVYLRAAEKTIESSRSVIILVPEIALATQLEGQFIARFGEKVVLQHSGLHKTEKYDQYTLALAGKAQVVIGARSAIFAPLKNLGLIIVDEEHDGSYKQDDGLRYNARDMAIVRGTMQKCVVILGSATPSITSFANAQNGKYRLLEMDRRIGNAVLPKTTLVDLSKKGTLTSGSIISPLLAEKIKANIEQKHQTILLINRRGFSSALLCVRCGTPVQCPHCNVSLTLHKHNRSLVCHYCGHQQGFNVVCKECRSEKFSPAGFGTERVEEENISTFPDAIVSRIDSDVAKDRKRFHQLLGEMHQREIDILIGTQMIAKGHHFPYVTLVGVVWADGGMSIPDYKAAEKSFQLITQVNGRAGRGDLPGEVVIQTLRPEHYAIQFACKSRYRQFFEYENAIRQQPVFPPFVRLVLLRLQGKVESRVEEDSMMVARFCRQWLQDINRNRSRDTRYTLSVLGPVPSPLDKLKEKYRFQLLLKCTRSSLLHRLCNDLLQERKNVVHNDIQLTIDIDPENMM